MPISSLQQKTCIALVVLLALLLNWMPTLDVAAEQYLATAISDNLVIYATARSLNAIISVIQSIHFSINFGAGVGLNIGELLDPLNDLIERFSTLVLYGLAGLGLQKLVLMATSSLAMKTLTCLALVGGYLSWVLRGTGQTWLLKACLLIVLVRFCFIIEVGSIAVMDNLYFDAQTHHAHTALQLAQEKLSEIRELYMESSASEGIFSGLWETTVQVIGTDNDQGVTSLTARAVTELIVIMLVRGVLFPLVFIWCYISLMKWIVLMEVAANPDRISTTVRG